MSLFDINYKKLVVLLLPTFMRKPVLIAFLQSVTVPLMELHGSFSTNRQDNLYRLQMNGQVCLLRSLLNKKFDLEKQRIRISDGVVEGVWQYAWDEEQIYTNCLLVQPVMLWDTAIILKATSGFAVFLPQELNNDTNAFQVKSYMNNFKLLSKSYTLQ